MMPGLIAGTGFVVTGLAAHGLFHRNSPVFGRVLSRLPGRARTVALTFDDGPHPQTTPRILDVLRQERVPATFFVLGKYAERWPDLARRATDEGHEVGNHGFAHNRLHFAGRSRVREDLERGTEAAVRACQRAPRLFRAPHGFRSPFVTPIANSLGQATVGWTYGVRDSDCPGAEVIAARVLERVSPGAIILLHDADGHDAARDRRQTAEALPLIIGGLRARGYGFAAL
jgi:peptidoglycan/xylan/chitin deacetylase (PgdA/CDA1 family)